MENLHTDGTEVLLQNELQKDINENSATFSPSNTHVSAKVEKVCHSTNKCNKQKCPNRDQIHSNEVSTIVSDTNKIQGLATIDNRDTDFSTDTYHHTLAVSHLDPALTNAGFEPTYANTAIPLPVWENRINCIDYNLCVAQNGSVFGALPIIDQIIYQGPPSIMVQLQIF